MTSAIILVGCTQRQAGAQYGESLAEAMRVRGEAVQRLEGPEWAAPDAFADDVGSLREVRRSLDRAAPPSDVEPAHPRMLEGLESLEQAAAAMRDCVPAADGTRGAGELDQLAEECRERLDPAMLEEMRLDFFEADEIYEAAGYEVARPQEDG